MKQCLWYYTMLWEANTPGKKERKNENAWNACSIHVRKGTQYRIFWRSMSEVKSKLWQRQTLYSFACKSAWPLGKADDSGCNIYITTTWAEFNLPGANEQGCLWEKINCALLKPTGTALPGKPGYSRGHQNLPAHRQPAVPAWQRNQSAQPGGCVSLTQASKPQGGSPLPQAVHGCGRAAFWRFREVGIPGPWGGEY